MKRTGNLIPQIASNENLLLAFYKAKKGKEANNEVWEFARSLKSNLSDLQSKILSAQVAVGNYHYFTIYDPKKRVICAAPFSQRVLHHALMNICHPYFEKFQIYDSYATRIDKGTFKAVEKARHYHASNPYYLKMDVRKYFDSICHLKLMNLLTMQFKDDKLLQIFLQIIDSYEVEKNRGLPIGNLTSQYFANHYLSVFDHFVKEVLNVKAYVRYMDDMVVWHNSLTELQEIEKRANEFLEGKLKLELKTKFINKSKHGLTFLGFRLYPKRILLSSRSKTRYSRKMKQVTRELHDSEISQLAYQQRVTALNAFAEKAYSKRFRENVLCQLGEY
ncbi:MAG: Group II intron-encoded protein LtrA [Bacteroidetes bacterium ADurb.Bin408]|nr:MAG: Group II intron-encoded protein LtrA [Bacteroidetes bacterium ADurb.Bin408]